MADYAIVTYDIFMVIWDIWCMKRISLLCFDSAFSSVITGLLDLFSLAGVTWNRIQGESPQPLFQVELVSADGAAVRCLNNLIIQPDRSLAESTASDIIFIPPIGGHIEKTLDRHADTLIWLREMHRAGAQIAGSCTGTFLLAESGLLDHKLATTHWGYVDQFRSRYPKVQLKPEHLITNEIDLFCAGGGSAWLDLALFLIELHFGHDVAVQTAKALVIERKQQSQVPYSTVRGQTYHGDGTILAVQQWMEANLDQKINVDQLGQQFGMGSRTFKRRFKRATGDTPLNYLQSLRIEYAKKLLDSTRLPIDRITQRVGYEDSSSFMKLFKRKTGISPHNYRNTFNRNSALRQTPGVR